MGAWLCSEGRALSFQARFRCGEALGGVTLHRSVQNCIQSPGLTCPLAPGVHLAGRWRRGGILGCGETVGFRVVC